jgi:hypothetical protein
MANVNAPFGFADSHRLGAAVNYQMSRRWISASNPVAIFTGDPIVQLSTGYIAQATTPGATQIAGIFCGCEYMSVSQKKWIASPFWPGSDAVVGGTGFDVHAKVIDDPLTVFRVQTNGYPAAGTLASVIGTIGMNGQYVIGTGNTVTGKSGSAIDVVTNVPAVTNTFPFRIIDVIRDPPGANGADITTPYYWYYVTFNNQDFKSLTGI